MSHVTVPVLLTTREVADLLKIHPTSLANARSEGRGMPYVRLGTRIRYRADEVAALLAASVVVPANA